MSCDPRRGFGAEAVLLLASVLRRDEAVQQYITDLRGRLDKAIQAAEYIVECLLEVSAAGWEVDVPDGRSR